MNTSQFRPHFNEVLPKIIISGVKYLFGAMKGKKDYYEILGVSRDADEEEIRRAYKRLAMKYHPDRNPDPKAAELMKEVNEAYAVLSDPEKRQIYDLRGHRGFKGLTYDDLVRGVDFGSLFDEIFGSFFGGGLFENLFGRMEREGSPFVQARRKGRDVQKELEISLEEAAFGTEKAVKFSQTRPCPKCRGKGAEKVESCRECDGLGKIVMERRSGFAFFRQVQPCPKCRGTGMFIKESCRLCKGSGVKEEEREVKVMIPKGVDSGSFIKLEGEGEVGGGEYPGDLYLMLQVKPHPIFERKGYDIWTEKEITFTQAALGGKVYDIPGLDGRLELEIPPGTESGATFEIEGEGIPYPDEEERGSEFIKLKVVIPDNLSQEEANLLQQLECLRTSKLDPLFLSQRRFGLLALPQAKEGKRWPSKLEG